MQSRSGTEIAEDTSPIRCRGSPTSPLFKNVRPSLAPRMGSAHRSSSRNSPCPIQAERNEHISRRAQSFSCLPNRTPTPQRLDGGRKDSVVTSPLTPNGNSSPPKMSIARGDVPSTRSNESLLRLSFSSVRDLGLQQRPGGMERHVSPQGRCSPKGPRVDLLKRQANSEESITDHGASQGQISVLQDENRSLREELEAAKREAEDLRQERDVLRGLAEASLSPMVSGQLAITTQILPWTEVSAMLDQATEIGRGSFGPVYRAVTKAGTDVAIKTLALESPQGVSQFYRELHVLSFLRHPNVVQLHAVSKGSQSRLAIIYELAKVGDLVGQLTNAAFAWSARLRCALGIAQGLQCLHEHGIIHRDLKPANVLLFEEFHPKITDFGISRLISRSFDGDEAATQAVGTPGYIAPEVVTTGQVSPDSDMYAFGVVMLQLLVGVPSAISRGEHILQRSIESFQPRPVAFPSPVEAEWKRLVKGATLPAMRPRFKLKAVIVCLRQLGDTPGTEDDDCKDCVICLEKPRVQRLPCGHKVLCEDCVTTVCQCPMCRQPFEPIEVADDVDSQTFVSPYRALR